MILTVAFLWAAEPAVVVLPASGGPDEATIRRTLDAADLESDHTIDAGRFVSGVAHVPLAPPAGVDCSGPLGLDAWHKLLARARSRFDDLDAPGALSDLLDLDVELECFTDPLPAEELYAMGLLRAETHLVLGTAARRDEAQAEFHAQEAAAALDRVVVLGIDDPEEEPSPDLARALAEAEARREERAPMRIAVVGLRAGEEAWVNGRPLDRNAAQAGPGDNLVQRVRDGEVTAAGRVQLREGEGAVFDFSRDETPLRDVVAALVFRRPDEQAEALLVALAAVRAAPYEAIVYVGWDEGRPAVWQVVGQDLGRLTVPPVRRTETPAPTRTPSERRRDDDPERRPSPRPSARNEGWRAATGVWAAGGWRSEDGDGRLGFGLAGRVAVTPQWAVAWAATPLASAASFDPAGDGLVAEWPVRVGARWGPHRPGWAGEAGLDLGVRWAPAATPAVRPLLAACGGGGRALGPATGLRGEVCLDTDFAGVGLVASLGIESRI